MRGFFGVLNSNTKNYEEVTSLFQNEFDAYQVMNSESFFLADFDSKSKELSDLFPDLCFAGWCRLDNLEDLSSSLGISPQSSDPIFILTAYKKWGVDCVKHFIGDFSFVVYNKSSKSLLLAKDHLGIRPLFYLNTNGLFIFSTSLYIIKKTLSNTLDLNELYIAKELKNYPQEIGDTFFKNVFRLKPAHYIVNESNSKIKEIRYWDLETIPLTNCRTDEDYLNLLRETMTEAIRCRLRNKENIGAQLSGGIDSSAIVVLLSRISNKKKLHTYSFVLDEITKTFSETGVDEKTTQQMIVEYANLDITNHHEVTRFHYSDVFDELKTRNLIMGGLANSDCIWQDSMYKYASSNQKIEVMFSGFHGDEGISDGGQLFFFDYLYHRNFIELVKFIYQFRRDALKKIRRYFLFKKLGTQVPSFAATQAENDILKEDSPLKGQIKDTSFQFFPSYKGYLKQKMLNPNTCLRSESEGLYANSHGIETVYPFADIRILQIVYSLPTRIFKPKPYTRALFRNVCKGILPEPVRTQNKYNGATTLAFYDFWNFKKSEQLREYKLKNLTGLLMSEEDYIKKNKLENPESNDRIVAMKEIDYLIELNWPQK
jgi:asparagine synthase (glutamine-hydrolysing)